MSHSPFQQHYNQMVPVLRTSPGMTESDFFLIVLVDARHLDYSDNRSLLKTLVKHPSDGSKNSDVGHAWIYLQGIVDGERVFVEGGHSGELGCIQAKYFEGVMNGINYGDPNPSSDHKKRPRDEPNPIKYLWATQYDGFFQEGSGNHVPTFAAKVDLSEEQFQRILTFIDPQNYHYHEYALSRNQCSSFVAQVASLANFSISCETTISIEPELKVGGERLRLWKDPQYSHFTFSTPDVIEVSLMEAVVEGRAEYALDWYRLHNPWKLQRKVQSVRESFQCLPERVQRLWLYYCL